MNIICKAAMACALAVLAAAPAAAQIIVEPYGGPYAYTVRHALLRLCLCAGVPIPEQLRYGYDTSGTPYSRDELGWQPGWNSGAPANPCWSGQRIQNRC